MPGLPRGSEASSSFLQKRTKKPLLLRHLGWISARAHGSRFLRLFSKISASLLRFGMAQVTINWCAAPRDKLGWQTAPVDYQGLKQDFAWHEACDDRLIHPGVAEMTHAVPVTARSFRRGGAVLAAAFAMACLAGAARACDGKSYTQDVAVGQIASGGGLQVQIDKLRLLDKDPDKYTISVKDDNDVLGDHVVLTQYDTISFKTRCGTVSIGADRKSMFHHNTLTVNWSYF
jgi:hypothetical protein